ncbi:MAG: starch-binding protein, partial [Acutalibacteraceae bacterium]
MGNLRKSAAVLLAVLMMLSSFTCLSAFAADDAVYTKITSLSDLTAGDYLITATVDGTTYAVTSNGTAMTPVTVTPSGDSITNPDATAVFTFAAGSTDGTFTIKGSTGKFINNTTSTTGSWADAGVDVTITCTDGNFLLAVPSGRALALYKDNTKVRWYAPENLGSNGTQSINLYKLGGSSSGPVAEANTIYFTNNNNWSNVYVYMFDDNGLENADWPGEKATFVETNDYGQDVYKYYYGTAAYTGVVFNDGSSVQTVDIPMTDEYNGYYLSTKDANGDYTVIGYNYGVAAPVEPDTKRTITITSNVDDAAIVEVNDTDSGEYNEGDTVDLLALVYDETYTFAGWYEVIDGVRADTPICEDEEGTYTVGANDVVLTAYVLKEGESIDDPVTPVEPEADYNQISSLEDVTAGTYIITATAESIEYAFTGEAKMKPAAATVSSGRVVAPTDSMVWEFEDATDGNFYIKNKATGQYLGGATSTTTVFTDTATEPFAVTLNSDGSFRISCTSASTRILAMYNTTEGRWYTSASSYNVQLSLYKLGAESNVTTSLVYFTKPTTWGDTIRVWAWNTEKNNAESFDVAPEMTFVET